MDLFNSISNGFISALAREFFSRLFNFVIENKEKIISVFKKILDIRDYYTSNYQTNTSFAFNGKQFVVHV